MLAEVETELAKLDRLPTEPVSFDISKRLGPEEIRGTMRAQWFTRARACYESLRGRSRMAGR